MRKIDIRGDDWLPEDDDSDEEGSFSEDYDWSHSMDYEQELDQFFDDITR